MLKLAASRYLKSVGDKVFHPNPDYAEWENVDCLDVIIKRKPKWFWQKPVYTYDHLGLNHLLDSPLIIDKSVYHEPELLNPNFLYNSKHDIKGKIGGKIASLISLDLTADDVISLNINMEGIMKQSIDFAVVSELLKKKKVNLSSKYIQRLAQNKYNVLCLVTQYMYITKPTDIKVSINFSCDETNTNVPNKEVNFSGSGNCKENKDKTITFAAGTKLAFDFAECLINPDGSIELIDRSEGYHKKNMIPDLLQDGHDLHSDIHVTVDKQNLDIPDYGKQDDISELTKVLNQIMNNKNNLEITKNLLLLTLENNVALRQFELLLIDIQQDLNDGQDTIDISSYNIKQIEIPSLLTLLKQIGFDIESPETIVKLTDLNTDIIGEILIKILSIYHLKEPYLKNLQDILNQSDNNKQQLLSYLQNLKNPNFQDNSIFEKLVEDNKIKLLFMSIGIVGENRNLNKYFEPTLILLHA